MSKSRLLRDIFLVALAAVALAAEGGITQDESSPSAFATARTPDGVGRMIQQVFENVIQERRNYEVPVAEKRSETSVKVERRAIPLVSFPSATPPPQRRQDNGQIQALSQQLQSLSQSATQAISSVSSSASSVSSLLSSSAQSVRQSAQQAIQSANQNAQQANQNAQQANDALSRTQSSASSAILSIQASASSQMSANLASAQSSASSAIDLAQSRASVSASNAMFLAASQIGEARADATAVRADANNLVTQVQQNSISTTNMVIIIIVCVVGTFVVTSLATWLFFLFRRRRRRNRENTGWGEKAIPVRVTQKSPRFTTPNVPFLRLPDMGLSASRGSQSQSQSPQIGIATSDYSDLMSGARQRGDNQKGSEKPADGDVYGVSPRSFRLQRPQSVLNAASVRLIRVKSKKEPSQQIERKPVPEQSAPTTADSAEPPPIATSLSNTFDASVVAGSMGGDNDDALSEVPSEPELRNPQPQRVMSKARFKFRDSMASDDSTNELWPARDSDHPLMTGSTARQSTLTQSRGRSSSNATARSGPGFSMFPKTPTPKGKRAAQA